MPGNIRSLNIVSGGISDYRHTAARLATFRVQLAGTKIMPAGISWLFMGIIRPIIKIIWIQEFLRKFS